MKKLRLLGLGLSPPQAIANEAAANEMWTTTQANAAANVAT